MPTWRPTSGEKPWPNSTKSRFLRLPCAYSGMAFRRAVTTALIQWWKGRDSNPRPRHYELRAAFSCHGLTLGRRTGRAQQLSPRTRQSLPQARGNAFALFRAADRLGICVQQDVQMNPVKNKSERSHALPRELWPILALIFTGPVLFVNVLLGGDRALQRAWIIGLIGLACFGFLGRRK